MSPQWPEPLVSPVPCLSLPTITLSLPLIPLATANTVPVIPYPPSRRPHTNATPSAPHTPRHSIHHGAHTSSPSPAGSSPLHRLCWFGRPSPLPAACFVLLHCSLSSSPSPPLAATHTSLNDSLRRLLETPPTDKLLSALSVCSPACPCGPTALPPQKTFLSAPGAPPPFPRTPPFHRQFHRRPICHTRLPPPARSRFTSPPPISKLRCSSLSAFHRSTTHFVPTTSGISRTPPLPTEVS